MILTIGHALSEQVLETILKDLTLVTWRDGTETAGAVARTVKQNDQADLSSRAGARIREVLFEHISRHPVLAAFARPAKYSRFLISRTRKGGGYGLHVDNPFMPSATDLIRTDLSFTLFLTSPEDYEGGELAIEAAGLTQKVKGEAGDLILYPSTSLHQVKTVTSGERIVCVGWIESQVRSHEKREILFDLENLKAELFRKHDANSMEMLMLAKTMANLKRMWISL